MKHLEDCSLRHKQIAEAVLNGSAINSQLIVPTMGINYTNSSYLHVNPYIRGGQRYREVRTVRLVAGSGGVCELIVNPILLPFLSSNDALVTDSTFAGTTTTVAATTGLTETKLAARAPYSFPGTGKELETNAFLEHFSLELMSNSSAVSDRSGRLYIGRQTVQDVSGWSGVYYEGQQDFRTFELSSIDTDDNPKYVHPIMARSVTGGAAPTELFGQRGNIILFGEGITAGTVLDFRMVVMVAYFGPNVPYDIPLALDQSSLDCAIACVAQSLPQGHAFAVRKLPAIKRTLKKTLGIEAARTTNFLGQLWDGAKWLWNNGGSDLAGVGLEALMALA
jgi:hypothetical protein